MYYNDHLAHHGVKGQKWGVRRKQNKNGNSRGTKNRKKPTYREKVEASMREYDKQHSERSTKDNYTIAIRNAERKEEERAMKVHIASMLLVPVAGIGMIPALANAFVSQKRENTLAQIMDEHNIETAKRVVNM